MKIRTQMSINPYHIISFFLTGFLSLCAAALSALQQPYIVAMSVSLTVLMVCLNLWCGWLVMTRQVSILIETWITITILWLGISFIGFFVAEQVIYLLFKH